MQVNFTTEKQKEKEILNDEGEALTSMLVDIPPSYDEVIGIGSPSMSSPRECALPSLPSPSAERVLPHKLHWKLGHLHKCQLGFFGYSHSAPQATVRMPLEHLSGVSLSGISNDSNAKLKHIKRCSLNLGIPMSITAIPVVQCQIAHVANCNIDLTGSQSNLLAELQLKHIKRSCIALGPIHGVVNASNVRRTAIVRASNLSAMTSMQSFNATSYFEASKLSRCTIDLRSNMNDPPLTKVMLSHLSHCAIYLDQVNGPVTLNQCKRCIVVIPSQQASLRKCSRIRAYVLPTTVIGTDRTKRLQLTALEAHQVFRGDQMHANAATASTSNGNPSPNTTMSGGIIGTAMPASPPQYHELFPPDDTFNKYREGLSTTTNNILAATHVKFSTRANDQADQWLGRTINAETWEDPSFPVGTAASSPSSCSVSSVSSISSHGDRKSEKRAMKEERKQAKHAQKLMRKSERYERKMQKLAMKFS